MNVIFPMAGFGTRFQKEGFSVLKPFIQINNRKIVDYAISSLNVKGKYIIISRELEVSQVAELNRIFKENEIEGEILYVEKPTSGAAETCLRAQGHINLEESLIITNCDQYTPWNNREFMKLTEREDIDAIVTTYDHGDIIIGKKSPYSFVKINEHGYATEFSEKFAISEHSLNGIHYWKKAKDFFDTAKEMIEMNNHNGITTENYISLTFNLLVQRGKKIAIHKMQKEEFYALGTPAEVEKNLVYLNF